MHKKKKFPLKTAKSPRKSYYIENEKVNMERSELNRFKVLHTLQSTP